MENFKYYNHLGFHNPYFIKKDNSIIVNSSFEDIISEVPSNERFLDFSSVVEVFSKGFCFGDRTLIKGVNKTPWMAKPNQDYSDWDYFTLPSPSPVLLNEIEVAEQFYNLLEQEIMNYVNPHKNIGILLTGGMDSRIVAAVLNNLIKQNKVSIKQVYAYTWGAEDSRDVVYASRIAEKYNWSWKHLVVDQDQMMLNCELAILNGCEYTPLHLHAMSKVSDETHLDCILAGSFGDSVGRAEFSGRKVNELTSLDGGITNIGGLLRSDFYLLSKNDISNDIKRYHELFPQNLLYKQYEQDQQLHYMRRMLNACMSVIDAKIPLYQAFTDPSVFSFMWALDPAIRTDNIYLNILKSKAPELMEFNWARTGLQYPLRHGEGDLYKKKHHDYGQMIRKFFLQKIDQAISKNKDNAKVLFNISSIDNLIKNLQRYPMNGKYMFEEKLLYIAQVLIFIDRFNVQIELPSKNLDLLVSFKEDLKYKARFLHSKIR